MLGGMELHIEELVEHGMQSIELSAELELVLLIVLQSQALRI